MVLQSTSDSDSYPFQLTRSISSATSARDSSLNPDCVSGHERARADEKQQPREVRADPVLLRHRGWVAHAEDEVRARAPRAVDEPRDVGRIVLAVAVDRDDVVCARAERPGGAFQHLAEPCSQGHAFSAVDGELQHEASARVQMLGRVVDRPVVDRDNGIRERHRPGDDVSASRRGVVAGNDDSDPLGHVECCQRIAFLVGRVGYGLRRRRRQRSRSQTEKRSQRRRNGEARMVSHRRKGATPAKCRASGRARAARSAAAWVRQDGRREHHRPYVFASAVLTHPHGADLRSAPEPRLFAFALASSPFRLRFLRFSVCESVVSVSSVTSHPGAVAVRRRIMPLMRAQF